MTKQEMIEALTAQYKADLCELSEEELHAIQDNKFDGYSGGFRPPVGRPKKLKKWPAPSSSSLKLKSQQ